MAVETEVRPEAAEEVATKRATADGAGYSITAMLPDFMQQGWAEAASATSDVLERAQKVASQIQFYAENKEAVDAHIATGDSMTVAVMRVALPDMTATQMLDSMAENSPALSGIVEQLRANPELAEKIRVAAIQDPSILTGIEKMADPEGGSPIDLAKFEEALQNPNNVRVLGQVFDKIAADPNDNFNFATLETLAGHVAKNEQVKAAALLQTMGIDPMGGFGMADMFKFMKEFLQDPQQAINGIIDQMNDAGLIPAEELETVRQYAAEAGTMMSPLVSGLSNALPDGAISRLENFVAPVTESDLTNFSPEQFAERFKTAMDGLGADYDNPEHVRAALTEMDPDMAARITAMDATALKDGFNTAVTEGTTLEALTAKAQAYYNSLRTGATMDASVSTMAATNG